jgi:two-component system sensor histidine kinase PilS (NtrC family)
VPGEDGSAQVLRSDISTTKPDGSPIHLGYNATPLTAESGEVRGVVVIFQDLTEVFKLEQEVRRQEKLAALGTLAAGLAHEIRNPLASMRGSVQVLAGEIALDDQQKRLMDIITRESERLNRTVSDFLAYARPAPFTPVEFDLKRAVADAVMLLRHSSEVLPGHEIVERFPAGPTRFVGDPNQVRQIFWNLARNGLQAMPERGTLTVGLSELASGRGYELTVQDEGVGMTDEQLGRLFVPFATNTRGGTGLGMAIVYQFVQEHGGRIDVASAPGTGTTIKVTLPDDHKPGHEALARQEPVRARS